jgi:hypothetical protein
MAPLILNIYFRYFAYDNFYWKLVALVMTPRVSFEVETKSVYSVLQVFALSFMPCSEHGEKTSFP